MFWDCPCFTAITDRYVFLHKYTRSTINITYTKIRRKKSTESIFQTVSNSGSVSSTNRGTFFHCYNHSKKSGIIWWNQKSICQGLLWTAMRITSLWLEKIRWQITYLRHYLKLQQIERTLLLDDKDLQIQHHLKLDITFSRDCWKKISLYTYSG